MLRDFLSLSDYSDLSDYIHFFLSGSLEFLAKILLDLRRLGGGDVI